MTQYKEGGRGGEGNLNNFFTFNIFTLLTLMLSVQLVLCPVVIPLHSIEMLAKQDTVRTSCTGTRYRGWSSRLRLSWYSKEQKCINVLLTIKITHLSTSGIDSPLTEQELSSIQLEEFPCPRPGGGRRGDTCGSSETSKLLSVKRLISVLLISGSRSEGELSSKVSEGGKKEGSCSSTVLSSSAWFVIGL